MSDTVCVQHQNILEGKKWSSPEYSRVNNKALDLK